MDRAVGRSAICADKLRRRNVSLSRSVATEACRRAKNGELFAERVRDRKPGIVLDIIEPAEEARLAVLGCHKLLEPGDGPALIFDIGGGSTELVLVDQDEGTPQHPRLVERAVGRRLADRKRGQGSARRAGPDQGLQAHARARAPRLRQFRDHAARRSARASACSAPAAR